MRVNRIVHMFICKYLWNSKWQSFFEDRVLMWTKNSEDYYRTKVAYKFQLEEDDNIDSTHKNKTSQNGSEAP